MGVSLEMERLTRLRAAMAETAMDWLVLVGDAWRSDYLRFALDITPMEGQVIVLIPLSGPTQVYTSHAAEAARLLRQPLVSCAASAADLLGTVTSVLASIDAAHAGLAPASAMPTTLAQGALGGSIDATTAMLDRLMVRKSMAEADAVERAVVLADAGYAVFRDAARVGRQEFELVADLESWFRQQGCAENFMIMGSGGMEMRTMRPPGERRLMEGDLVTTELTPCVDGYYAQICRTLVIGTPTQAQLDAYAVYVEALEAGVAAVRPGATHGDVARAQNDVFRRHGLAEYITSKYTRVRGHGMGLYVDGPHVLEDVNLVLEPEMTLVVHPNTYHPGAGYIVLGDTVRVTQDGCRVLTRTPRALASVPATMQGN